MNHASYIGKNRTVRNRIDKIQLLRIDLFHLFYLIRLDNGADTRHFNCRKRPLLQFRQFFRLRFSKGNKDGLFTLCQKCPQGIRHLVLRRILRRMVPVPRYIRVLVPGSIWRHQLRTYRVKRKKVPAVHHRIPVTHFPPGQSHRFPPFVHHDFGQHAHAAVKAVIGLSHLGAVVFLTV